MKPENIDSFSSRFEDVVAGTITDDLLCPEINIDTEIQFSQIDGKFQRIIAQMAPFGPDNFAPIFVSHNVFCVGNPYIVGTKHLKLNVKQQNSSTFDGIGFGLAELQNDLRPNIPFSICYTIEENVWKDQKRLQLNIKAIKFDDGFSPLEKQ